jgi:hypothetical protein
MSEDFEEFVGELKRTLRKMANDSNKIVDILRKHNISDLEAYHFVLFSLASMDDYLFSETVALARALRNAILSMKR